MLDVHSGINDPYSEIDTVLEAELLRRSYYDFVVEAWEQVEPNPFVDNWHIGAVCEHLQAVSEGQIQHLVINIPPGTSKSILSCQLWQPWEWARDPTSRWLFISHNLSLISENAVRRRKILESPWYRRRFSARMPRDQNSKLEFATTAGGVCVAKTTCSPVTGMHPHRIVFDDPNPAKGVESQKKRAAGNDWYDAEVTSRGVSVGVHRVIIQQRLHVKDLTGHVLSGEDAENWTHLYLPMRMEKDRKCTTIIGWTGLSPKEGAILTHNTNAAEKLGFTKEEVRENENGDLERPIKWTDPRVEDGELLDKVRYPNAIVLGMERDLGAYSAAGQLQQRPNVLGGAFFKPTHIEIIQKSQIPFTRVFRVVRAFDKAATKNAGCYTAGPLLALQKKDHSRFAFYILDVVRDRWSTDEVEDQIALWARVDAAEFGSKYRLVFEHEGGASGPQAAAETTRRLRGLPVKAIRPRTNKQARWEPVANSIAAYEFYMVEAPWNKALVEEMRDCPNGEFVDQLDSLALAYDELTQGENWMLPESTAGQSPLQKCSNPKCNRFIPEDSEIKFCCEGCQLSDATDRDVTQESGAYGHTTACDHYHAGLYRQNKWSPNNVARH